MKYIGLNRQIQRNNTRSFLLLIAFPSLLLGMFYVFFFFLEKQDIEQANYRFLVALPFVLAATAIWFLVAWKGHAFFIRLATGAQPLERMENKRVYNLLENLCIAEGMTMPALYIIDDDSLNAFASGINKKTFAITLSKGIIEKLDDEELEAVIAHELTHIKNGDVRLMIISIIFVGIFSFLAEIAFRSLPFAGSNRKNNKDDRNTGILMLIAILVTAIAYLISLFLRFGISRSREYLADAGAAEITKKPYALASALRKISGDPLIEAVKSRDVAQLFIDNPKLSGNKSSPMGSLFATHPPIKKRITLLEQFV